MTTLMVDSMVSGGCVIEGGRVENSVLSPNVKVGDGADVRNSVIMEGVVIGSGAKIQNAIIDKEVVIPPSIEIGYNLNVDAQRFTLTTSGVVIVAKKTPVGRIK